MNYEESLAYISSTYVMGIKLGLENIRRLLTLLGNPEDKMKIIHVAGTNGKGSTCAFLSGVLTEAGYKVGLYTSPYLEVFNERIRINNENVSNEKLAECTTIVREKIEQMVAEGYAHPSEFEVTTAIGFLCFAMEQVDFLVLEVGMGGRFDATNAIKSPVATIITSISIDHVQYLGDTLKAIAFEKAGIIKENIPLILYPQEREAEEEILRVARERKAEVFPVRPEQIQLLSASLHGQTFSLKDKDFCYPRLNISLLGEHQLKNALTAIRALHILKDRGIISFDEDTLKRGLSKTKWAGRLELMAQQPITIIDGAHNEGGAQVLAKTIRELLSDYEITLVFGMLRDKDIHKVADILIPVADKIITATPNSDRAMPAAELADLLSKYDKPVTAALSINDAVAKAKVVTPKQKGAIIYAGSLYMIGEIRTLLKNSEE